MPCQKIPKPETRPLKKPDQCQQVVYLFQRQLLVGSKFTVFTFLCVQLCLATNPKTRKPEIKKPELTGSTHQESFYLYNYLTHGFKVSVYNHINFVMCIAVWTMPILYFSCAVISEIMYIFFVALGTSLNAHQETSLAIATMISLIFSCAFGSINATASLSATEPFICQSFLEKLKVF